MRDFFKGLKEGFSFKGDWQVHVIVFLVAMLVELVGSKTLTIGDPSGFALPLSIPTVLFAFVTGIMIAKKSQVTQKAHSAINSFVALGVCFLIGRLASSMGPNWDKIVAAGPALLLQEVGNLLTVCISVPLGVLLFKMGRTVIGAGFSIARESSIAIIGSKYGLDTEEGIGVMGAYALVGFDPVIISLLASLMIAAGWFHPYSLAMASGIGCVASSAAGLTPLLEAFPEMAETISAYGVTSQTMSGSTAVYVNLLISLPLANWLFKTFSHKPKKDRAAKTIEGGK